MSTVLRYRLPDPGALSELGAARLEPTVEHTGEAVMYDTFDGLLWAGGAMLMHALGELRLIGSDVTVALETAPQALRASDLPEGELRDRLAPLLEKRAAVVQARITGSASQYKLLDELDKTIARVEIRDASAGGHALGVRAHVWPLRGYEEETEALFAGRFEPCVTTLYEDAMAALGRPVEGISAKVSVDLAARERADAAVSQVLLALWSVIDANLEGTIADTDSEFLHDYRVSIRRTRAVLKEMGGVFGVEELEFWRAEFRWLQQITGDARDLDVNVEDFAALTALVPAAERAALAPLLSVLKGRRLAAHRAMVRELRSDRARRLAQDWPRFLVALPDQPRAERPDARARIDTVASERILKRYRRMVKMGNAISDASAPESYHDLRKQGKSLRYLLELFGEPLHDRTVVRPMVKALKALQDVLGRHQDREVQSETVRGLAGEVSAHPGGAEALMAMGTLAGALEADARAARSEFAEAFAAFSSEAQRTLVKETFGP